MFQLFESLRKQDPKRLEEKTRALAEKEAAQSAKAQQRLGALVCENVVEVWQILTVGRLEAIRRYPSPSPPSDLLEPTIRGGLSSTDYSIHFLA